MNDKTLRIVLIVAVAIVWLLIIVKIVGKVNNPDDNINSGVLEQDRELAIEIDSFSIMANYRDPFLKNRYYPRQPKKNSKQNKQKKPEKKEKEASPVQFPSIDYKGMVNNKKKKTAILVYKQQSHLLRESENVEGVLVRQIYPDSVLLEYEGMEKMIKK